MKIPTISPLTYIGIGVGISVINFIAKGGFDPFLLTFFMLAAIIEFFSRKQEKVPSQIISFIVPFVFILFVKTNIIDFKRLSNSSLEPLIHSGAVVFYQPNFYKINNNDLVIIKEYIGAKNLFCKVISIGEQSYTLEIVSMKKSIEVSKDNLVGKIIHIAN